MYNIKNVSVSFSVCLMAAACVSCLSQYVYLPSKRAKSITLKHFFPFIVTKQEKGRVTEEKY